MKDYEYSDSLALRPEEDGFEHCDFRFIAFTHLVKQFLRLSDHHFDVCIDQLWIGNGSHLSFFQSNVQLQHQRTIMAGTEGAFPRLLRVCNQMCKTTFLVYSSRP